LKKKLSMLLVLSLILSLVPASALLASNGADDNAEYENGYEDTDMDTGATPEETDDDADVADEATDDDVDTDAEATPEATADEDEDVDLDVDIFVPAEEPEENEEPEDAPEEDLPEVVVPVPPIGEIIGTPIAEDMGGITLRFVIGEETFTRNNVPQELDVAPYIEAGRTMVPLAAISAGLDASVRWDAPTRTVHIVRGAITLAINVDEPLPGDMGMPAMVDGRTFVPLAYVSEMLGATTRWDPAYRAVYVTD
jgi:hypothetical protein